VRAQAQRHKGSVEIIVIGDEAIIQVKCTKGHGWTNDFRPRQGQRWCRECRRAELAEHKALIRQQEEAERQRIADE